MKSNLAAKYAAFLVILSLATAGSVLAGKTHGQAVKKGAAGDLAPEQTVLPEAQAAYLDMKKAMGVVPTFLKSFPQESVASEWEIMKTVQMNPNTMLPPKIKELMGLAVAAQIPCKYCTYFHTEAARLNGATEREIHEAIAIAGDARRWSAFFYGSQVEMSAFRKDVDRMMDHARDEMKAMAESKTPAKPELPAVITDAKSARADIEKTFGFYPSFLAMYPESTLAAAWKIQRGLFMNPTTSIAPKYRDLISLAVSSQAPCAYCTYFDTESAKLDGASQGELQETIMMAGIVRNISTVLNGSQTDEKVFKNEVDGIFKRMRDQMKAKSMAGSVPETHAPAQKQAHSAAH